MSAIGTKRTCASALQMSAFGGKADMPVFGPQWLALMTQSGHFPGGGLAPPQRPPFESSHLSLLISASRGVV